MMQPNRNGLVVMAIAIDAIALVLLIIGGSIGSNKGAGIALIVAGFVLLQVTWIPTLMARRAKRLGRSSVHPVGSDGASREL